METKGWFEDTQMFLKLRYSFYSSALENNAFSAELPIRLVIFLIMK